MDWVEIDATPAGTEGHSTSGRPMVPAQADRRVERTRRALTRALIGLLETRDYDAITVSEILDAADVGRSTFYSHFSSKDDLLRYGLEKLGRELRSPVGGQGRSGSGFGFVGPLLDHVAADRELFRRLKGRGAKVYRHGLEQLLGELTRDAHSMSSRPFDPVRELEIRFVAGALSAAILWWLERNSSLEPREVVAVMLRLLGAGIAGGQGS